MQGTLGWVEESQQHLALLLLDFEKVFNHIDWGYFFEALKFNQLWTKWVASLYKGASSSTKINNHPKP
jgi:hypothetical protein